MRKFQILRYLKKWKYIIIIIAIVGSIGVYWYGSKNQSYTATAVIEYKNPDAATGKNPDGTEIDSSEIISAAVITDVISDLSLKTNVEDIRSKCKITEVIPDEETEKKKAALEQGKDYEYIVTRYQISFTVGSGSSKDYARDVLDSILTNYFSFYCEKYVDYAVFPNNATNISTDQYDYIDCVDMLESAAEEIGYYLNLRATSYPGFRSAVTGYSFKDLEDRYDNIKEEKIPRVYSYLLNNKLVIDKEVLLKRYENNKAQYELEISNLETHIKEAKQLIDHFGDKTLEKNDINYSFGGGNGSNEGLIINNVQDGNATVETTYDKLINQYVDLQSQKIRLQTRLSKCKEILEVFDDKSIKNDKESEKAAAAIEDIDAITKELNDLYASIVPTIDEFNEQNGADNLATLSSISQKARYNMDIYIMLAIVFFLVVGVGVAIFLGRAGDFVDYFMYTDRKTNLPNRSRCDIAIEQYEAKLLPDSFVCMVCVVELRKNQKPDYTRKDGDVILRKFSNYLKHIISDESFIGYNNEGMFICFFENCTVHKANEFAKRLRDAVDTYNKNPEVFPILFGTGVAETTESQTYSARNLLRLAISSAFSDRDQAISEE